MVKPRMTASVRSKIWLAVIAGITPIAVALIQYHPWHKSPIPEHNLSIGGYVFNVDTGTPIGQARVTLGARAESTYTDDVGNFTIELRDLGSPVGDVRVHVTKDGFRPADITAFPPTNKVTIGLHKQ